MRLKCRTQDYRNEKRQDGVIMEPHHVPEKAEKEHNPHVKKGVPQRKGTDYTEDEYERKEYLFRDGECFYIKFYPHDTNEEKKNRRNQIRTEHPVNHSRMVFKE